MTFVSLTGADDAVSVHELTHMTLKYPFVEWGILYFPEKDGEHRNPTRQWRKKFLESTLPGAAHLCGSQVFRDILGANFARLHDELKGYSRLQLNINARHKIFSDYEVECVYNRLLSAGYTIVLQYHDESAYLIERFLVSLCDSESRSRVHILFDTSKGRGVKPAIWPQPVAYLVKDETKEDTLKNFTPFSGYAGGLGPLHLKEELVFIDRCANGNPYYIDMESNIRDEKNQFSFMMCESVLQQAEDFLENKKGP